MSMEVPKGLKILHLTTHLNTGGITTYISELGTEMTKRGYDITVLSAGGELEEELAAKNLDVLKFSIRTKSLLSPKLFMALPKIVRLVKQRRFDLIHAHTRVTQGLASAVSFLTRVPYISTAHGFYRRRFGRRIFPAWGRRVIAISPLVAEELEKTHKVPRPNIRIVFNGIDVEGHRKKIMGKNPAEVRRAMAIGQNTFVIGCISRLVRDKGHEYLIEAVARLKKKHADVFLVMVGGGREEKRLQRLILDQRLADKALLLPSERDITSILSILDVFVHPATFREGFGLAMLEAMAAKVPVVASDIWAINSIIRHGVNGLLVKPKSASEIEKALASVIENPELAGAMAQSAYAMARDAYSIERMASELETVYSEVLGK